MSNRATELAQQYLALSGRIKELGANLASMRRDLKKLDESLLQEMKISGLTEVVLGGATLECGSKLKVKNGSSTST
jgi:hypothetical protein